MDKYLEKPLLGNTKPNVSLFNIKDGFYISQSKDGVILHGHFKPNPWHAYGEDVTYQFGDDDTLYEKLCQYNNCYTHRY